MFLPLVALLAFAYFSEMMNYVIGPIGPKFSPAVSKELKKTWSRLTECHSSAMKTYIL